MSKENILFDNAVMKAELERILQHIENDDPVPSHVWLMIKHPGIEEGQWTTDSLYEFLSLLANPDSDANAYTVWSNVVDKAPSMEADEIIGNQNLLRGATGINITDFILAGTKSPAIIQDHSRVFMFLAMGPWRFVVEAEPDVRDRVHSAMKCLIERSIVRDVHNNKKAMKKEYDRIFSALLKGEVVLSHWYLSIKYNGDTGGNVWTPERIRACLQDIVDTNEGNNARAAWVASPKEHLEKLIVPENILSAPDYASWPFINLSTFIWLGCQQDDIVHGPLLPVFVMIILFPFGESIGTNKAPWIKDTGNLVEQVNKVLKNHTTH